MADEFINVIVSDAMAEVIGELDDAEFDLVLKLLAHLPDDIEDFCRANVSALSLIARVHPHAFVCVRQSAGSNNWIVVKIYEDGDPDVLPPGGGRSFAPIVHSGADAVFPALPDVLRDLFRIGVDTVDRPAVRVAPLAISEAFVATDALTIPAFTELLKFEFEPEFFIGEFPQEFQSAYTYSITSRYLECSDNLTADIMPELSLMPSTEKSVPEPNAGHKP